MHEPWTRKREMIEMHANDMASRDMLRTVDPMTLFAVSG